MGMQPSLYVPYMLPPSQVQLMNLAALPQPIIQNSVDLGLDQLRTDANGVQWLDLDKFDAETLLDEENNLMIMPIMLDGQKTYYGMEFDPEIYQNLDDVHQLMYLGRFRDKMKAVGQKIKNGAKKFGSKVKQVGKKVLEKAKPIIHKVN